MPVSDLIDIKDGYHYVSIPVALAAYKFSKQSLSKNRKLTVITFVESIETYLNPARSITLDVDDIRFNLDSPAAYCLLHDKAYNCWYSIPLQCDEDKYNWFFAWDFFEPVGQHIDVYGANIKVYRTKNCPYMRLTINNKLRNSVLTKFGQLYNIKNTSNLGISLRNPTKFPSSRGSSSFKDKYITGKIYNIETKETLVTCWIENFMELHKISVKGTLSECKNFDWKFKVTFDSSFSQTELRKLLG